MTKDTGNSGTGSVATAQRGAGATGAAGGVVLVVDDSATVRAYHSSILGAAGFTVREACNGYEALELALTDRFALLLVDVNMPVMDGFALLAAIRTQALIPQVPIIMVSSEQDPSDADEAYRKGANLYMVKPADPAVLVLNAQVLTGRFPAPETTAPNAAGPETDAPDAAGPDIVPMRSGVPRPGGDS